jgi:hypothetical protein
VPQPTSENNTGKFEGNEEDEEKADDENLRDSKTIFTYNIIKKKNPKVNVVTELIT